MAKKKTTIGVAASFSVSLGDVAEYMTYIQANQAVITAIESGAVTEPEKILAMLKRADADLDAGTLQRGAPPGQPSIAP